MITGNKNIYLFNPEINELQLNESKVLSAMGYKGIESPEYFRPLIYKFIQETSSHASTKCGYVLFDESEIQINRTKIYINELNFEVDPVISLHLKGSTNLAVFTVTLGINFDEWVIELNNAGQHLEAFVVDTIGAELAESAADWLQAELEKFAKQFGKITSNRVSPGYCNWNVADQKKLFSLLPEDFCGISLNEFAMMIPRKSISGIIGIGGNVKKLDYQCNICDLENCYKRK